MVDPYEMLSSCTGDARATQKAMHFTSHPLSLSTSHVSSSREEHPCSLDLPFPREASDKVGVDGVGRNLSSLLLFLSRFFVVFRSSSLAFVVLLLLL